ncbi:RadC family protein [Vaginella massiliensis]|uniref:RadC family protein n=1 Tax=Vaginella massiliensis TaxID=1816680 RepID=UPI000839553D|nr:DNA repair protein RadC [Vaginella massiliensis]
MEKYKPDNSSIKNWAEDDRPREKLALKGRSALSDAELLAIILGSGNREESAVELAKRILNNTQHNWNELAKFSIQDLCQFKGVGEAKAISIITALEIGRRRNAQAILERPKISSSQDAFQLLSPQIGDLAIEEFWIMFLNQGNRVLKLEQISRGGITQTAVDIRIIFKKALELMATAIILAHNHPSGNLIASEADKALTRKITEAAKYLDIQVLDHLIVGQKNYLSFADQGMM